MLVAAKAEAARRLERSWFSSLPAEAKRRLNAIKDAYKSGRYTTTTRSSVVAAIYSLVKEHEWPVPRCHDTIHRWLTSTNT